jgi:CRP/FNR family transcriptional regulator, polysaccharide utilization system transcription regulator
MEESQLAKKIGTILSQKKFSFFTKEEQKDFESERKIVKIKKGHKIITEGLDPDGVYCVIKGTAKLFIHGSSGKEQILRFLKEGDMTGYRSILCNEPFGASAIAMEEMEICFISKSYFLKILENDPIVSFKILKRISKELGEASRAITVLAQKTVRERLAEVLLLLENKLGVDGDGFVNISLTREEVANLIGTATESAIRLISEFKSDQLIEVNGRKIKILDHKKLSRLGNITPQ